MRLLLPLLILAACVGVGLWHAETSAIAEPPAVVTTPDGVQLTGRYEVQGDLHVLTLWGSPRERGYAQGYLLGETIVRGIEHDFERVLKPFIPMYESIVRKGVVPKFAFSPRELEELEGIYEGMQARVPEAERVVKGLGRPFDLTDLKALNTFGDWYGLGCSSLAVWGDLTTDGRPLVGRNFDFPGFYLVVKAQYVCVRAVDGEARGQVGISYPGCIGTTTGMNTSGVFVAVHDVRIKPTMDKAMRPNVPRLIAVRRLLEQTHGGEACTQALELARAWPTLYGNNLMVVAPEASETSPRAAVLEYDCRVDLEGGCSFRIVDAEGVKPEDALPAFCLTCTNHHRCRETPAGYTDLYQRWRFPLLAAAGAEGEPATGRFDVDAMFQRMGRVSFPQSGTQQLATAIRGKERAHGTLHQVVGEPAARRLHVKLGAVGKHVRDLPATTFDVGGRVAAAKAP